MLEGAGVGTLSEDEVAAEMASIQKSLQQRKWLLKGKVGGGGEAADGEEDAPPLDFADILRSEDVQVRGASLVRTVQRRRYVCVCVCVCACVCVCVCVCVRAA